LPNYKGVAVAFVVLTLVFAAGTGYLLAFPQTRVTTTTEVVTTTASAGYSVNVAYKQGIGYYLTNGTGFTLYMFSADTPGNGSSACNGTCAGVWPPFYAAALNLPPGLNSSSFATITRSGGGKQTTYNGWPLYYFKPDTKSGSTAGEGIDHFGGMWYAIPPTMQQAGGQIIGGPTYNIGIAYKASIGLYLTNGTGFTLYFRSTDTPNTGKTTCDVALCEANWPAFYEPTLSVPPGLTASSFSTINPYNSTKIVAFDGYALFTWAHDGAPGDTTGEGIGGFYVATIPTLAVPSSATTSTTT
jgi:predicted lipoprotein with Yx(FWY)xxD motif